MAGMINPSFRDTIDDIEEIKNRLNGIEKDIENLKLEIKSNTDNLDEKKIDVNSNDDSNIIELNSIMNTENKSVIKNDIPDKAYYVGNRSLDLLQDEINNMMLKFNENINLSMLS